MIRQNLLYGPQLYSLRALRLDVNTLGGDLLVVKLLGHPKPLASCKAICKMQLFFRISSGLTDSVTHYSTSC